MVTLSGCVYQVVDVSANIGDARKITTVITDIAVHLMLVVGAGTGPPCSIFQGWPWETPQYYYVVRIISGTCGP